MNFSKGSENVANRNLLIVDDDAPFRDGWSRRCEDEDLK